MIVFRRPKRSVAGCFSTLLFFIVVLIVFSGLVRGCQQPYWHAMRVRKSDPCLAAHLFAEDIRLDRKSSLNSEFKLSSLESACAIREIVALMDLPDGSYVNADSREDLWHSLQQQASRISQPIPNYDPAGSLETRKSEQIEWQQWLKIHNIK
jgi:hypothetical protein